jgi:hypothetical protein
MSWLPVHPTMVQLKGQVVVGVLPLLVVAWKHGGSMVVMRQASLGGGQQVTMRPSATASQRPTAACSLTPAGWLAADGAQKAAQKAASAELRAATKAVNMLAIVGRLALLPAGGALGA